MMLQIGELSRKAGVNPQTIYFYERIGLIPKPKRTDSGYRLFDEKEVKRLFFITQAKALGLNLDEIKEILSLQEEQSLPCREVYQRLLHKVEQIQETISQLQTLEGELVKLLHRCEDNLSRYGSTTPCVVFGENQYETKDRSVG
ncbi:heavy metal-responsive transcriptional regulator [Chamaesiphon sp.]|uniref:heavy metal-responsive transcriptional regulator n=1 Tax=Chamaesiphon sp. TaxID=2814140 RepID=UPI0035942EEF